MNILFAGTNGTASIAGVGELVFVGAARTSDKHAKGKIVCGVRRMMRIVLWILTLRK